MAIYVANEFDCLWHSNRIEKNKNCVCSHTKRPYAYAHFDKIFIRLLSFLPLTLQTNMQNICERWREEKAAAAAAGAWTASKFHFYKQMSLQMCTTHIERAKSNSIQMWHIFVPKRNCVLCTSIAPSLVSKAAAAVATAAATAEKNLIKHKNIVILFDVQKKRKEK